MAVNVLMDWVEQRTCRTALSAVGHRVLQGGAKYYKPQRITAELVADRGFSSSIP
jgi:acetate kinase